MSHKMLTIITIKNNNYYYYHHVFKSSNLICKFCYLQNLVLSLAFSCSIPVHPLNRLAAEFFFFQVLTFLRSFHYDVVKQAIPSQIISDRVCFPMTNYVQDLCLIFHSSQNLFICYLVWPLYLSILLQQNVFVYISNPYKGMLQDKQFVSFFYKFKLKLLRQLSCLSECRLVMVICDLSLLIHQLSYVSRLPS